MGIAYGTDMAIIAIVYWITWFRVVCPVKIQPNVTILLNANQMAATSGTTGD
jgi:hypothetical protein